MKYKILNVVFISLILSISSLVNVANAGIINVTGNLYNGNYIDGGGIEVLFDGYNQLNAFSYSQIISATVSFGFTDDEDVGTQTQVISNRRKTYEGLNPYNSTEWAEQYKQDVTTVVTNERESVKVSGAGIAHGIISSSYKEEVRIDSGKDTIERIFDFGPNPISQFMWRETVSTNYTQNVGYNSFDADLILDIDFQDPLIGFVLCHWCMSFQVIALEGDARLAFARMDITVADEVIPDSPTDVPEPSTLLLMLLAFAVLLHQQKESAW